MKRAGIVLVLAAAVLAGGLWQAAPTEAQGRPTVALPDNAAQVAPNVFSLGTTVHNGRVVEGLLFVRTTGVAHPAKGGIPGPPGGGGGGDDDEPPPEPSDPSGDASCFSFIDPAEANWPGAEPYVFDGSGSGVGVSVADMNAALVAWDSEVGAAIFDTAASASGSGLGVALDDSNEAFFARLIGPGANGVIAATWVWFEPGTDFVEWDMVFNTRFKWSLNAGVAAGEPGEGGAMDFLNIATHEAGHAAGMGHTADTETCSGETMFPSGSKGETLKRTLAAGDVAGIIALY